MYKRERVNHAIQIQRSHPPYKSFQKIEYIISIFCLPSLRNWVLGDRSSVDNRVVLLARRMVKNCRAVSHRRSVPRKLAPQRQRYKLESPSCEFIEFADSSSRLHIETFRVSSITIARLVAKNFRGERKRNKTVSRQVSKRSKKPEEFFGEWRGRSRRACRTENELQATQGCETRGAMP